jgi:hypothetical protein
MVERGWSPYDTILERNFTYYNLDIYNFVRVEIAVEAVERAKRGIPDKTCRNAKLILLQHPILPHNLLLSFLVRIHPIQPPII